MTEDLRAIQRQLNCAAMEAPSDPELMEALSQLPEMDALQMLKSAVDQMRHFLWFYMQVMTNESESGERLRQSIRQKVSADAGARPGSVIPGKIQDRIRRRPDALSLRRKKPKAELDSRQSSVVSQKPNRDCVAFRVVPASCRLSRGRLALGLSINSPRQAQFRNVFPVFSVY